MELMLLYRLKNLLYLLWMKLTLEAEKTQSVNTIYLENNKVIGHNTDIGGFEKVFKI